MSQKVEEIFKLFMLLKYCQCNCYCVIIIPGWKRKGWKLASGEPVKNEKDFKELDSLQHKLNVKWNYVEAHRGVYGNEMADQLAKAGAAMYKK